MSEQDTLSELLARIEKASGPDDALDAAIFFDLDPQYEPPRKFKKLQQDNYPAYTASLDAALALVERVAGEWTAIELRSRRRKTRWVADLSKLSDDDDEPLEGFSEEISATGQGPTPALALLAALLRALQTGSTK